MARTTHALESESQDLRLRCPKDGTIMEKTALGSPSSSVTVDRCAKCGALWMDKGEMEQVLAMGQAKSADLGPFGRDKPNAPITALMCPRDGNVLTEIADATQHHVLIMLCAGQDGCGGKLLDAGELTDLSEFTMMERVKAALKLG